MARRKRTAEEEAWRKMSDPAPMSRSRVLAVRRQETAR